MLFTRFALLLALSGCHAQPVAAPAARSVMQVSAPSAPTGDWVMHLYVGERHFADQLHLNADGTGTLTVPGNFSAPVEKLRLEHDELSFEILAPEGDKPFRVFNRGRLQGTTMAGFATLADGSVMGAYVATQQAKP